jgi:glutamate--cysteine ligase
MEQHALSDYHRDGEHPNGPWLIGAEHELLCIDSKGEAPGYGGTSGIRAVLKTLGEATGMKASMEGDTPIGLQGKTASVTLEPGGQLELAGSARSSLHEVADEVRHFQSLLEGIGKELGLRFFGMGLRPVQALPEIPLMPKSRYQIMKTVMPRLGRRSLEMMFSTATVQTNLDYGSEADMARKFRASACLSPIVAALFANSPYQNAKPTGRMSERYAIWDHTDTQRSGRFAWMLDAPLSYQAYVDFAKAQRMIFRVQDGRYIEAGDQSFAAMLKTGEVGLGDWSDHLGGIFPEVRLKNLIELRSADGGCGEMVVALNALWVGLLYDEQALDEALALSADWRSNAWEKLAQSASRDGLSGSCELGSMLELATELLRIADQGLARRQIADASDKDERRHLAPLHALVHMGASSAELLLRRFGDDGLAARRFCAEKLWEFPW